MVAQEKAADQYRQVLVLYLRRPFHDRYSNRGALEGRVRYSDLKEAAPRGSLWVLYMVEQVLMICKVAVGGCARQLQREIVRFEAATEAEEKAGTALWAS